jgi:hypothetical protein
VADGRSPAGLDLFATTLERIVNWTGEPIALVADFASRLVIRQESLSQAEHQAFTRALILSQCARSAVRRTAPTFLQYTAFTS